MLDFLDNVRIINENDYASFMRCEVEPYLEKRRREDFFLSSDNKKLHYEAYEKHFSRGSIIILHGFTESAEKFREMTYYFRKAGYSVFVPDLRGHGKSYHDSEETGRVDIQSFDIYKNELDIFIEKVVKPLSGEKSINIYSHSLGSTVALLYLTEHPCTIAKAVLSSPMICGNMDIPVNVAGFAAKLLCKIGGKNISAPGRCVFDGEQTFENSDTTSRARFLYYLEKRKREPLYQTSGPSFSWVKASIEARDKILSYYSKTKPVTELIIFAPEEDRQLIYSYTEKFADEADVKIKKIRGSRHEIFMSRNDALGKYVEEILDFFGD